MYLMFLPPPCVFGQLVCQPSGNARVEIGENGDDELIPFSVLQKRSKPLHTATVTHDPAALFTANF